MWLVPPVRDRSPSAHEAIPMPDEPILRQKARDAILTGKLPGRRPDRTWGGPGVGAPCSICGEPVRRDQMEFEVQFEHDRAGTPGLDKFHIHPTFIVRRIMRAREEMYSHVV